MNDVVFGGGVGSVGFRSQIDAVYVVCVCVFVHVKLSGMCVLYVVRHLFLQ